MDHMRQRDWQNSNNDWGRGPNNGKVVFGIILAGLGLLMLLKMFHVLPAIVYSIHFGWPLILVIIGLVIGAKSNFRNNAWWILMLIGGFHLLPPFYIGDVPARRVLWPMLFILGGLAMVFRRGRSVNHFTGRTVTSDQSEIYPRVTTRDADTVNIDVTFGGRKEIITSRSFKGGRVRATFAGAEINMVAADSEIQPMVLEVHASFAGIELIVPSHWEIQNEINPTMGSVEDNRSIRTTDTSAEKRVLILRGSCSFGSVEVKSY
jgi:hypothetical protein